VKHGQISEQGVIGDMGSPVKLIATCAECGHESGADHTRSLFMHNP